MIGMKLISLDVVEECVHKLTSNLLEYFGFPETNEHYAAGVRSSVTLAAKIRDNYILLLSLGFLYLNNSNIYILAIFRASHRQFRNIYEK